MCRSSLLAFLLEELARCRWVVVVADMVGEIVAGSEDLLNNKEDVLAHSYVEELSEQ